MSTFFLHRACSVLFIRTITTPSQSLSIPSTFARSFSLGFVKHPLYSRGPRPRDVSIESHYSPTEKSQSTLLRLSLSSLSSPSSNVLLDEGFSSSLLDERSSSSLLDERCRLLSSSSCRLEDERCPLSRSSYLEDELRYSPSRLLLLPLSRSSAPLLELLWSLSRGSLSRSLSRPLSLPLSLVLSLVLSFPLSLSPDDAVAATNVGGGGPEWPTFIDAGMGRKATGATASISFGSTLTADTGFGAGAEEAVGRGPRVRHSSMSWRSWR